MPAPRLIIPKENLIELIDKRYNKREIQEKLNICKETLTRLMEEYNLEIKDKLDENIGKRFGKLVVLERLENSKDRRKVYNCRCDCGNNIKVKLKYLNNGDTKSCGCFEKDFSKYQEKNYKEAMKKVGEIHGKLTIIDVTIRKDKRAYDMICKCECGNISRKIYSHISSGDTLSCGCYSRELSSKRMSENILKIIKNGNNNKWYFIKDKKIVHCRSGYEVLYANYLITNKIKFEYEPECFKLRSGKRYTPDFYLIDEKMYIEVKGIPYEILDRSNQKNSVEIFRENHKLDIYYWKDLYEICELPYKSYSNYSVRAKILGVKVEDYLGKLMYLPN